MKEAEHYDTKEIKYALTVTLLALSTACLATGCKKKHDKIDLSGSQAAESTVQTAPVSTTATESESSSSITIEPGIENAQSQGTSAGGPPHPFPCPLKQTPTRMAMFPFNIRSFLITL